MNEQNGQTGDRTSKEDIRELRRQLEDWMVTIGFTPEERQILFTVLEYKAPWLISRLTVYDNRKDMATRHLAEVILAREENTSSLPLEMRMEIARKERPSLRTAFIRLFAVDEAAAKRAQMPLSSRTAFETEKRRGLIWPK